MSPLDDDDEDYHISVSRRVPADWATGTGSKVTHCPHTLYNARSTFGMATPISVYSGKTMLSGRTTGPFETRQRGTLQRRPTYAGSINVLPYVNVGVAIAALLAIIALIFIATVGLSRTGSSA